MDQRAQTIPEFFTELAKENPEMTVRWITYVMSDYRPLLVSMGRLTGEERLRVLDVLEPAERLIVQAVMSALYFLKKSSDENGPATVCTLCSAAILSAQVDPTRAMAGGAVVIATPNDEPLDFTTIPVHRQRTLITCATCTQDAGSREGLRRRLMRAMGNVLGEMPHEELHEDSPTEGRA